MLRNEKMTYREIYRWGQARLESAEVAEAAENARLLLEYCCGTDRSTLLAHGERIVSAEEYERYRDCIAKRSEHIPLQHITGEQEFMGLSFAVNKNVLIPRQDTEILVEEVLRYLHDGMRILDMCTGSGCILLSLLHYSNGCKGVGVDFSEDALQIARENAGRVFGQGIEAYDGQKQPKAAGEAAGECKTRSPEEQGIAWIRSDLFEKIESGVKFDMIVSNPPYIRTAVIDTLMPEVKDYEPYAALDGREDGLYFYRKIIAQAGAYLNREGMLFFEIGYDQGEDVRRLMEEAGYREVEVVKDYAGLDRVVYGTYGL